MSANVQDVSPSARSIVKIKAPANATEANIRTALSSDHNLRIAKDHWLVTALGATDMVLDEGGGTFAVSALAHDWILLHVLKINADLKACRANWVLRPRFSSEIWEHLQSAGGLVSDKYEDEAAVMAAVA